MMKPFKIEQLVDLAQKINPTYIPLQGETFKDFTNDKRILFQPSNVPNNEPLYANSHI